MTDSALTARALDWCLAEVPGAVRVLSSERLRGGIAAITHAVSIELSDGTERELVLRRFAGPRTPDWPPIAREVAALARLSEHALDFALPRVVAHDETARACDLPAILMTRLAGRIDVSLTSVEPKVRNLGRVLATLHGVELQPPPEYAKYTLPAGPEPERPSSVGVDWRRVFRALRSLTFDREQLLHGDFHLGNVLFAGGRITGVVDWTLVRSGPPLSEVGYCRADLSMLFGLEAADQFLEAYESARGGRVQARSLWDLAGAARAYPDPASWVPGWVDAGRDDLSTDLARDRLVAFVERALLGL